MALIKCKECGQMVSDRAVKCPRCGAVINKDEEKQIPTREKRTNSAPILIIIGVTCAIAIIVLIILFSIHRRTPSLYFYSEEISSYNEGEANDHNDQYSSDTIIYEQPIEQPSQSNEQTHQAQDIRSAYIAQINEWKRKIQNGGDCSWANYFLFDITHNGVPELWVTTGSCEANRMFHIYTYGSDGLKEIYEGGNSHSGFYRGKDYIIRMNAHMGYAYWTKITYSNGKITEEEIFEEDTTTDDRNYAEPKEEYIEEFESDNLAPINGMIAD